MAIDMGKMVGPLPVGAWVGVVGAGLAFSVYKKKKTATATAGTDTQLGNVPMTDATVGNIGAMLQALNSGGTGYGTQTIQDNQSWYKHALDNLLGHGFDPTLADSALRKYMQGYSLTTAEQSVINEALRLVGGLPTPPPPPLTSGTGGTAAGSTVPDSGTSGSTLVNPLPVTDPTPATLSNHDLIAAGNQHYSQGSDYEPYVNTIVNRVGPNPGDISVNDPQWHDPNTGKPIAVAYPTMPLVLGKIASANGGNVPLPTGPIDPAWLNAMANAGPDAMDRFNRMAAIDAQNKAAFAQSLSNPANLAAFNAMFGH